jgi:hypothetical protein
VDVSESDSLAFGELDDIAAFLSVLELALRVGGL